MPKQLSPWWQMVSGMRAYAVAITVIWAASASTVLVVLALVSSKPWWRLAFGGGAVVELMFSAVTLLFLLRASNAGRFDV